MTTTQIVSKESLGLDVESMDDMFADKGPVAMSGDDLAKIQELKAYIDQNGWIYDVLG